MRLIASHFIQKLSGAFKITNELFLIKMYNFIKL